jgi:hypothetical protein
MSTNPHCSNRWKPWLLPSGSPVPPVSGDALLAVPNIAALMALPTATIDDGGVVAVKSVMDTWMLDKTSGLAPDGITVVPALGGGNWLRMEIPSQKWLLQPNWFIDPLTGDNENIGATAGTALLTFAEWKRRVGTRLEIPQTLNIQDDLTEDLLFDMDNEQVYVVVQGLRTVLYSGTVTAARPWDPLAALPDGEITDVAIPVSWTASALVDKLIVLTSGASAGSAGFVAKDMGAKTARYSPLIDANTYLTYDFVPGDTFDVVSLTTINGTIEVVGSCHVIPVDLSARSLTGTDTFLARSGGRIFPFFCDIEMPFIEASDAGFIDFTGCRLKTTVNQFVFIVESGTCYLDACLMKVQLRNQRAGMSICTTKTLAQGDVGGVWVGINCLSNGYFANQEWFAVFDEPTTGAALRNDGGMAGLYDYLWGNGGASNFGIQVFGAGSVVYTFTPTYGPAVVADVFVGGLQRPYASLPVHNASKMCGIVQR